MAGGVSLGAAYWREVVARQQGSGLAVAEFCRREGLAMPTFYAWKKRLKGTTKAAFAEVVIDQPEPSGTIEIVLPDDVLVRCTGAVSREQLATVLECLGGGA